MYFAVGTFIRFLLMALLFMIIILLCSTGWGFKLLTKVCLQSSAANIVVHFFINGVWFGMSLPIHSDGFEGLTVCPINSCLTNSVKTLF